MSMTQSYAIPSLVLLHTWVWKFLGWLNFYPNLSYANGQSALDVIQALNGHPFQVLSANHDEGNKKKDTVNNNKT